MAAVVLGSELGAAVAGPGPARDAVVDVPVDHASDARVGLGRPVDDHAEAAVHDLAPAHAPAVVQGDPGRVEGLELDFGVVLVRQNRRHVLGLHVLVQLLVDEHARREIAAGQGPLEVGLLLSGAARTYRMSGIGVGTPRVVARIKAMVEATTARTDGTRKYGLAKRLAKPGPGRS